MVSRFERDTGRDVSPSFNSDNSSEWLPHRFLLFHEVTVNVALLSRTLMVISHQLRRAVMHLHRAAVDLNARNVKVLPAQKC
jgi:hypothetical protein